MSDTTQATKADIDQIRDELASARKAITERQDLTNGRVTSVEHDFYGHDGQGGLMASHNEISGIVKDAHAVLRAAKWGMGAMGVAVTILLTAVGLLLRAAGVI